MAATAAGSSISDGVPTSAEPVPPGAMSTSCGRSSVAVTDPDDTSTVDRRSPEATMQADAVIERQELVDA